MYRKLKKIENLTFFTMRAPIFHSNRFLSWSWYTTILIQSFLPILKLFGIFEGGQFGQKCSKWAIPTVLTPLKYGKQHEYSKKALDQYCSISWSCQKSIGAKNWGQHCEKKSNFRFFWNFLYIYLEFPIQNLTLWWGGQMTSNDAQIFFPNSLWYLCIK